MIQRLKRIYRSQKLLLFGKFIAYHDGGITGLKNRLMVVPELADFVKRTIKSYCVNPFLSKPLR